MAILAPVDGTARSKRTVGIAHDLAVAFDDELFVLHVIPRDEYEAHKASLEDIPEFAGLTIDQEANSAAEVASETALAAIDGLDVDDFTARGRVGRIGEEILDEVDRLDPHFLVIGGRRRSPAGKAVWGDTTQQLLLNATCPVVTQLADR